MVLLNLNRLLHIISFFLPFYSNKFVGCSRARENDRDRLVVGMLLTRTIYSVISYQVLIWDFIASEFLVKRAHQFFPLRISIQKEKLIVLGGHHSNYSRNTYKYIFGGNICGTRAFPYFNSMSCEISVCVFYHTHSLKWRTDMRSIVNAAVSTIKNAGTCFRFSYTFAISESIYRLMLMLMDDR